MARCSDIAILLSLPFKILYYMCESAILWMVPLSLRRKQCIEGDTALVTGAGNGIGRHVALGLAAKGVRVALLDRDVQAVTSVHQEIRSRGGQAHIFICDLSSRKQIYETAASIRSTIGEVTILINNAGVVNGKTILDLCDEEIENSFAVNVMAHFWMVRAFLPDMMSQNRGHIVTISSVAAVAGIRKLGDYCASKAAATILHETVATEVRVAGYKGIHATLVAPYLVDTGMFAGATSRFPWITPILGPAVVAEKVIQAILYKEAKVTLPAIMRFLIPIYRILPTKIVESKDDIFGLQRCMDNFTGRKRSAHSDL
ncbi:short-chain dehydrogenase/reductase family 16C member 6-like [Paramacrobiotus metropolitanus]|uniref:short-chain dehydrogenase/reductase family 16C member 6-like n=1 Tax=Paramacrobiotus metropolitanus TaxID=2943436 RepID=UPI0024462C3D|nr:short-chain dehydrogenase/reductase family 16C member 6-like [Paramacrobiotus metropolitanus]